MEMKILLIQTKPNDTIKSLHIVSNKQATYVCPLNRRTVKESMDSIVHINGLNDFLKHYGYSICI